MSFLQKKIISAFLLPLPISIILLILALLSLLFLKKRTLGISLLVLVTVILIGFGLPYLPNQLLNGLESQYQPLNKPPAGVNNIVVLGGGVRGKTNAPPNTQLGSASLARLVEAMRLYHLAMNQGEQPKLILSGGRAFGSPSEAGKLRNTAVVLGINPSNIFIEGGSQDTYKESIYLKKYVGSKPFILVTSAYHMPRAMALFKKQGMQPIAAPTQYIARANRYSMKNYFPSAASILHADIALHEYFGLWWAKLNRQI